MNVDVHAHTVTPSIVTAAREGATLHGIELGTSDDGRLVSRVGDERMALPWPDFTQTPEERISRMDELGVDMHVLSLTPSLYYYGLDASDAAAFARMANDELSSIVSDHPDRFYGFGHLPLQDSAASVEEVERVMQAPGFVGVSIGTNVDGKDFDDPELFDVFEACARTGALVFVHPTRVRAAGFLPRYHLRNLVGNPLETTIAFATLVFGGVLDRLPDLQLCLAHGGGYACLGSGRFDHGASVRPEAQADEIPSQYLSRVYLDSLVHNPETLRLIADRAGIDRLMLASDYPADMGQPGPVEWVRSCTNFTPDEQQAILGGNFERFLAERAATKK